MWPCADRLAVRRHLGPVVPVARGDRRSADTGGGPDILGRREAIATAIRRGVGATCHTRSRADDGTRRMAGDHRRIVGR